MIGCSQIEVLPEIVRAVGKRCEVYLDGGVTQGTDVLKAVALGASMVILQTSIFIFILLIGEEGCLLFF